MLTGDENIVDVNRLVIDGERAMRIGLAGGAELYAQTMPLARQLDIT
jgi:hypothetical protein